MLTANTQLSKMVRCQVSESRLWLLRKRRAAALVIVVLVVSYSATGRAQGLQGVQDFADVGAGPFTAFNGPYRAAQSVQNVWKLQRKLSCAAGGGTLCAPGEQGSAQTNGNVYSALLIATSPAVFDSSNPSDTGGFSCIGPARDQNSCKTCTAMVAVGAAEAAVACVLRIDGANVRLSEQDQYFCGPNSQRTCEVGWTMTDAVKELVTRGSKLLKQSCLPYQPDPALVMTKEDLCKPKCKDVDPYASQGAFGYIAIGSYWSAQRQIRQYGSVITRMDINWKDFTSYFAKDPSGVYPGPKAGTLPDTAHAVICHGYNNIKEYWVCLNSWGSKFGVQGSFKVKFGVCNMIVDGQTYGITWSPKDKSKIAYIVEPIGLTWEGKSDCYSYTARPGDSISAIAIQMWGVPVGHPEKPIQQLLKDNANVITNLEDPITGKTLKVCKPRHEAITMATLPVKRTGQCTASGLFGFAVHFEGVEIAKPLAVANPGDCCRLCAATSGCQFWWFLSLSPYTLECNMYGLQNGPVTFGFWNHAEGGIITTGSHAAAVATNGCGPNMAPTQTLDDNGRHVWTKPGTYVFDGTAFVPVYRSHTDPQLWATDQMRAPKAPKFVNGAHFESWQACCKQAKLFGLRYWTFSRDKRCTFLVAAFDNAQPLFEMRKADGSVSGMIFNGWGLGL